MHPKYLLLLLAPIAGITGCSLSPENYIHSIENPENGLLVETQTENFKYSLQYRPYEYIFLKDNADKKPNKEDYARREKELNGLDYFLLTVKDISGKELIGRNKPHFGSVYDYFSMYFEHNIQRTCGSTDQPVALFHAEGLYGVENNIKIHIAFEKTCGETDDQYITFINELDGKSPVKILIKGESINQKPTFEF